MVINLDNGKLIRRKVANLPENGNDCRIVPANLGSEITGKKDQRKIWNQLILPRDKIDSFISAKSPTDQLKSGRIVQFLLPMNDNILLIHIVHLKVKKMS